jgi:4-hydroxybenzoate polyprenyltransferase
MLWAMRRSLALVLLKDSRPSRILHYLLLALFGASLSVSSCEGLLTPHLLLRFLLFFFMLFYAGQFAIVTNNIEDLEADKITNQNRPLVREQIPQKLYFRIGLGCQGIALALAAWVGQAELLTIGAISLLYYLYSVPPFRLKRYVLLAKFLIGINSFLVAVYGFVLAGGKAMEFPVHWAVFILVPVSLMANFIDLKDTEGDRHAGIKTLPVLIGQRRATYFMAAATMCTYTYAAILLSNVYVSLLIAGVSLIHLYLLLRVPYTEKPLFLLHNSLFLGLIVLHLILK